MDDSVIVDLQFKVDFRLPYEMIPWRIYDRMFKMYDHATGPFVISSIDKVKFDIAWHSHFQVVYPHTSSFRLMRAIT
jgi:hypothetical protein